jgi:NADH-quinone oxidoreductase subunit I
MNDNTGRGSIDLHAEACTSCMLCVRECPVWCIELTSHTEQVSEPGARRPRSVAVLDSFSIDWGLCMFCGICVEVCPFDALEWTPRREPSAGAKGDLIAGINRLDPDRR